MKQILITFLLLYLIQSSGVSQVDSIYCNTQKVLKGPYFGQTPPTETPELFAPGIISTNEKEALYGVFNDGKYIIFDRTPKNFKDYENYE